MRREFDQVLKLSKMFGRLALLPVIFSFLLGWAAVAQAQEETAKEYTSANFVVKYSIGGSADTTDAFAKRVSDEAERVLALARANGFKDPYGTSPWQIDIVAGASDAEAKAYVSQENNQTTFEVPNSFAQKTESTIEVGTVIFKAIFAAYVPDTAVLPYYVEYGSTSAAFYSVADGELKKKLLVSTLSNYASLGRTNPLLGQKQTASGFFTVLSEQYGGAKFFRDFYTHLATSEVSEALYKTTGQPLGILFHQTILSMYGEWAWRMDEVEGAWSKHDVTGATDEQVAKLNNNEPITISRTDKNVRLTSRAFTVPALAFDEAWSSSAPLKLTVNGPANAVVYLLVGTGESTRLAHYKVAMVKPGTPMLLKPDGINKVSLVVLRTSSGGTPDVTVDVQVNGQASEPVYEPLADFIANIGDRLKGTVDDPLLLQVQVDKAGADVAALEETVKSLEAQVAASPAPALSIKLQIGSKAAQINGAGKEMPVEAQIIDNRTYLPLRFIAEALGATVGWDGATRTAHLQLGDKKVSVTIDQGDPPARLVNGSTLVPVRFISESLGAKVGWDGATRTVTITR